MANRIKYTCASCGWTGSIVAAWADMKPRKCPTKRCKTSFLKNPDKLLTEMPKDESTGTTGAGRETSQPAQEGESGEEHGS